MSSSEDFLSIVKILGEKGGNLIMNCCFGTVTPTITETPTETPTPTVTETPTVTPTPTPTPTPTITDQPPPTFTITETPTNTPTSTPTDTPTPTPTITEEYEQLCSCKSPTNAGNAFSPSSAYFCYDQYNLPCFSSEVINNVLYYTGMCEWCWVEETKVWIQYRQCSDYGPGTEPPLGCSPNPTVTPSNTVTTTPAETPTTTPTVTATVTKTLPSATATEPL